MKLFKRFLGILLVALFVLSLLPETATVSKAAGYKVTISLGDVSNAYFESPTTKISVSGSGKVQNLVSGKEYQVAITDLSYGDTISFTPNDLVRFDSSKGPVKNYVKGLRISGGDEIVYEGSGTAVTITVKENEEYVVAYGVGAIKECTVQYSCSGVKGSNKKKVNFDKSEKLYSAVGEKLVVPARHFEGYIPTGVDVYVDSKSPSASESYYSIGKSDIVIDTKGNTKTVVDEVEIKALKEKTEVKFTYEVLNSTTTTETITRHDVITEKGPTQYVYDYQYVDGEPVISSSDNGGRTVINNRRESNRRGGDAEIPEVDDALGGGGEDAAGAANAANATTTIDEGQTPLAGDSSKPDDEGTEATIPETEPPKKGEKEKNSGMSLVIRVIITVTIFTLLLILSVIITSYIIRRRNYK